MNEVAKLNEKNVTKEFYKKVQENETIVLTPAYSADDYQHLRGFSVISVKDDEIGVSLTFANNYHVQIDLRIEDDGTYISQPYAGYVG